MTWRLMSEHAFPWSFDKIIVITFYKDEPEKLDIFRCIVGEHGALFLATQEKANG